MVDNWRRLPFGSAGSTTLTAFLGVVDRADGVAPFQRRPDLAEDLERVVDSRGLVAEQQREVDQCLSHHGRRPVRWLLENFRVGSNWCLVHATHMDADETQALAASGAVVCICPSTEANLGDGLFPLHDFLSAGGRIAIGSDSHISINPFEELRWLEYGQRLVTRQRMGSEGRVERRP